MILELGDKKPQVAADVFVAPNAVIVGDVIVGSQSSVWYGAVIRGDSGHIKVGARTSVQDNVVIHVNRVHPTIIGDDVVIGHGAVVEGSRVGNGVLIGMNATVLTGSIVGEGCIIAAGAVVRENAVFEPGMLVAGVPAKVKGVVSAEMRHLVSLAPQRYIEYSEMNRAATLGSKLPG